MTGLGESATLRANGVDVPVACKTARVPAPNRSNSFTDDKLMDTGMSSAVFTSFTSRGEVRVQEVTKDIYQVSF